MKKLFILPALCLFVTGATSTNVEPQISQHIRWERPVQPVNTKIDSIVIKTAELSDLIKQL